MTNHHIFNHNAFNSKLPPCQLSAKPQSWRQSIRIRSIPHLKPHPRIQNQCWVQNPRIHLNQIPLIQLPIPTIPLKAPLTLPGPLHLYPLQTPLHSGTPDTLRPLPIPRSIRLRHNVETIDEDVLHLLATRRRLPEREVRVCAIRRIGHVQHNRGTIVACGSEVRIAAEELWVECVVQVHHRLGGWNYGKGKSCCVGGEVCVVEVCAIVPGVWVCVLGVVPGYDKVDVACRLDLTPERDRLTCFAAVDEF